ncbi:putative mitochondrial hypothetical protein [Leptomonas pyrrhocoris]|uniref:Uncharacterized protein n=1 Tax=Leptomonas pyrrhocoris TaxID=157538 RepID=A0A0M9G7R5_LEPPY|nr:putative mitochondrial hypothetical protein [Leptomonas pyrrhocoris]KPA84293.1 putative mitochondrial hypothetical protein [Leptomonas pyrrhocoris]|eukprot:XP_015662732.1 putative mitochondrial hypothetical protein [Leptomonas pyrrhocoris]
MPPTGLPCFVSRPRCASRLAAVHGSNDTSAIVNVAARVTYRSFYSGLDESRVHRLRRSGITFNRPRGRDTFSVAFESRLRIVPLTQMSDLYGPIDASLITAVNADDPTSSAGNPLEQKKFMAGDAHIRRVVERKRRDEARLREKQDWHVLVVDPIELAAAAAPVPFPSPHPAYYQDWPTTASAASTRPPRASWRVLEQREASPYGDPSLPFFASADATTTTATVGEAAGGSSCLSEGNVARPFASSTASLPSNAYFYRPRDRRHLQQSGDTTLLAGTAVREITLHLPHPDSTPSHPLPPSPHAVRQRFYTAVCVDPDIHHDRFHREEAQVEMISAYRNILYEAAELATPAESGMNDAGSLRRSSATTRAAPFVADVVRVPALCQYSCGGRFLHELGKLNQQSVIKGFHRLSNEAKEELITNRCFTVEIYVPPLLLEQFEKAFLEEAWEAPTSTLNPGRTALYPGLAPPRTLLQYDGWIGKRAELIEAVETGGRSLLSGVKHALDGTPIEEKEVLPNLRVFGAREEQQRMLEGERRTAAAALDTPPGPSTYAPLRAGLQDDAAGRDEENGKTK